MVELQLDLVKLNARAIVFLGKLESQSICTFLCGVILLSSRAEVSETVVCKATIRTPLAKSYVHLQKPNAWNKSLLVMHEDEDVVPIPGQEPLGAHWSICCLSSLQVAVLPETLSATETPERITKCKKAHRKLP